MPKAKPMPPLEVIHELLEYDPMTGKFHWKERPMKYFEREQDHLTWNTKFSGVPALDSRRSGYCYGSIFGGNYTAHRVAWYYMTGEQPEEVDHEDGNRMNNRLVNLRGVTKLENGKNIKRPETNTSGHIGVFFHSQSGRWYSRIGKEYLGMFPTYDEAVVARKAAELAHHYHPNHGRSALSHKEA